MQILYHLTILPPKLAEAEALAQELKSLRGHFAGNINYLNPNLHSPIYIPRLGFGIHQLTALRRAEATIDLHHVYNPDPFPFPVLRWLRRPVVYSLLGGVGERRPAVNFLNKLAAVTVSDEESYERLQRWGVRNCFLVRPGIDSGRFTFQPAPEDGTIRLMMGSAPWTLAQFAVKGVDALIEAVRLCPNLHVVFLWRGVLSAEMQNRIRASGLEKQITMHDCFVDVNAVLATVHASIVLASDPQVVKAYPHSLLDSLAAGKPVFVSRAIPMAGYVEKTGCGWVVEQVSAQAIIAAVDHLVAHYANYQQAALLVGQRDFGQEIMIQAYEKVYHSVLAR